jgi:hypothetical protein
VLPADLFRTRCPPQSRGMVEPLERSSLNIAMSLGTIPIIIALLGGLSGLGGGPFYGTGYYGGGGLGLVLLIAIALVVLGRI